MDSIRETSSRYSGYRKPNLFVLGAAKSGTTPLFNYLTQQSSIFAPEIKEPHFFYNERCAGAPVLGEKDLGEYLGLFADALADEQVGEASTSYLYAANAPREIRRLQDDVRILVILRDPTERAYSQYWNQVRDGNEDLSFEQALRAEAGRKRDNWWHGFLYVETGHYTEQLSRYFDVFGRDNVQIHLFDDLHLNARGVCHEVFSFLGVDPTHEIEANKVYNRSEPVRSRLLAKLLRARIIKKPAAKVLPVTWKRSVGEGLRNANRKPVPKMNPKTEKELRKIFEEDTLALERMVGRDLSGWRP